MSFGMIVWSLICVAFGSGLTLFAQKVIGRSKKAKKVTSRVKKWADGQK